MNYSDLINGGFELLGGLLYILSIKAILEHKEVKGMSLLPNIFFTSWSIFNLYFYSYNNLWFSFFGGIFLGITNGIWLCLAIYYRYFYTPSKY